jgi:hypothetical protein
MTGIVAVRLVTEHGDGEQLGPSAQIARRPGPDLEPRGGEEILHHGQWHMDVPRGADREEPHDLAVAQQLDVHELRRSVTRPEVDQLRPPIRRNGVDEIGTEGRRRRESQYGQWVAVDAMDSSLSISGRLPGACW